MTLDLLYLRNLCWMDNVAVNRKGRPGVRGVFALISGYITLSPDLLFPQPKYCSTMTDRTVVE